jgi:hypothetical protein
LIMRFIIGNPSILGYDEPEKRKAADYKRKIHYPSAG